MSMRSPVTAAWAVLLVALASGPAHALSLADVSPLYFDGPGGYGFDPLAVAAAGFAPGYSGSPQDEWIPAGHVDLGLEIQIEQDLQLPPHQDPASPSVADPFIADSHWTLHNETGRTLVSPLLVFTTVLFDDYPPTPTALDGNLLEFLEYSSQGTDYVFGVIALPDLEDGESVDLNAALGTPLRYVVGGPLATDGADRVMPPLGLMVLASYVPVPEPAGVALWLASLPWLARRARCCARPPSV
jgi:hypothetical protein